MAEENEYEADSKIPIGPGTRVRLTFSLLLETGEEVDSTGEKPAEFSIGDGNLPPGFEAAMFGLKAGAKEKLFVSAEQGFGIAQEDNIQRLKRSQFQPNVELAEGLMMSFADAQNTELPGVILNIDEKYVEVDFNHPLAGKNLILQVVILSVQQLTSEIIRVGG